MSNDKKLPVIYKPKENLGFIGYLFLIIIIGFSLVGVLKTFENDLLNSFPETEQLFILLDEQLKYVSEKVELLKYKAIIALNNKTNPLAASSLKNHMKGLVM